MREAKPIRQPEKDNPFWRQLLRELAAVFRGEVEIVFPTEWNNHYFSWFHSIEETGFRRELQYSFEEVKKSLENPELLFWFVTVDDEPQILLFGYSIPDGEAKSFYLDTLAVKRRGEGTGNIVMEFLIRWAKTKQYQAIVLDTELRDEKGIPLHHFYAKHGFKVVSISENDVVMKRML
ncbi:MAG TPA: GNAT family N-acetyltransferase [Candidatus Bathyarchaeota archaeon]|nr:GNAT family N-acetyltransferase [Candidatus Bathyarchaeota archaeon]